MTEVRSSGSPEQFALRVADTAAAAAYYHGLFGWELTADGAFLLDGRRVAHVERGTGGWLPYLAVTDLVATLGTVAAAGGAAGATTRDAVLGERAVVLDPTGAPLGLAAPGTAVAVEAMGQPGAVVWVEEKTRDRAAASAFLTSLFGYSFFGPEKRGVARPFRGGGPLFGGVMEFDDRWAADEAAHWLVYVEVQDVEQVVDRARALGGSVWFTPFDTPLGRMGYLRDTDSNAFAVVAVSAGGRAMLAA